MKYSGLVPGSMMWEHPIVCVLLRNIKTDVSDSAEHISALRPFQTQRDNGTIALWKPLFHDGF